MAPLVYSLCALTAVLCAWLLLRAYRRTGARLLLWAGLCFAGLTISNVLLVVDLVFVPGITLVALRYATTLAAMSLLLYGLIWEMK